MRRLLSRRAAVPAAAVLAVLVAVAALAVVDVQGWWGSSPWASVAAGPAAAGAAQEDGRDGCGTVEEVWVVAGDGLAPALEALDPASLGPDDDGVCAALRVVGQQEAETAAALATGLDSPRRADVWVPDSSLWAGRVQTDGVQVEAVASLGTSPVVVASNPETLAAAGWTTEAPTWADVLGGEAAIAVAALEDSSSAVLALAASRGDGAFGGGLLTVRTVLARQQMGALSPTQGLAMAAAGGAEAPLVLTSEQDVLRRTQGSTTPLLAAVAPRDRTPVLDYPVLAVPAVTAREPADEAAVTLVLDALSGEAGRAVGTAAGLRGPDVGPVPGSAALVEVAGPLVYPDAEAIDAVLTDLGTLAPATQLLVVVDVSLSMSAEVGDGFTRADVAAEALSRGLADLPEQTRVSLWQFASSLQPGADYVEVLPSRRLDAQVEGAGTQRELLDQAVAALPASLVDGGTSLYDTADAAMAAAREQYDPATVSTVVLITDGRNEDSDGLDLPAVTERLAAGVDPARPVSLVAVAFGPDADLEALQQLAAAAGGGSIATSARNPEALRGLIVQLLAARTLQPAPAPAP